MTTHDLELPPARNNADAHAHGSQLFLYLIRYEFGTAYLTIDDLELAHHAGLYALAGKYELGIVVDRCQYTQAVITATLAARKQEVKERAAALEQLANGTSSPTDTGNGNGNGGTKVPTHPVTPTMPPAPTYADFKF